MSFLQKKRKLDHVRSERKEIRKEGKRTRVTPEEITKFFDQSVDSRQSGPAHDTNDLATGSERRHRDLHDSRSSPAKLGHERYDGIGTDDIRRHQAPSMIIHGHSKGESHRRESSVMAGTTRSVSHKKVHPKPHQPQHSPATSQVWWPTTPSERLAHPAQQQRQPSVSNREGELLLGNDIPRTSTSQPSVAPESSHPHTISVSDPSMDHFTRGILLNKSATLEKHPTSVMHGNYLNLDDLKDISRIPELCHRLDHKVHPNQSRQFQNIYGKQDSSNSQLKPRQPPHLSLRTNDETVLPQWAVREPGRLQKHWSEVRNDSSHLPESNPVTDFSAGKHRIMPQLWEDAAATVRYPHMAYIEHSEHENSFNLLPSHEPMECYVGIEALQSTNTNVHHEPGYGPDHVAGGAIRMDYDANANDNVYVVPHGSQQLPSFSHCRSEELLFANPEQEDLDFAAPEPWTELDDFDRRLLGLRPAETHKPIAQPVYTGFEHEPVALEDSIGVPTYSTRASSHWGLHLPSLTHGANTGLHLDVGDFDAFSRPNILY